MNWWRASVGIENAERFDRSGGHRDRRVRRRDRGATQLATGAHPEFARAHGDRGSTLPPRQPSLLPELFSRLCGLPVREPVDKQPVAAETVWFAPADYHLLIERERTFSLSVDPPVRFSRPSVDVLFESAAYAYGARLAAVAMADAVREPTTMVRRVQQAGAQRPEASLRWCRIPPRRALTRRCP